MMSDMPLDLSQSVSPVHKQAKKHASSVRELVLIGVAAAFYATFIPHITKSSVASGIEKIEHPFTCPPQWLPVVLASNSHEMLSTRRRTAEANPGCTARFQVSGEVNQLPDTASFVPIVVTLDGTQIGFPVDGTTTTTSCDQIAAIGVNDGNVRGVSFLITAGFSLGFIGVSDEDIEFKYWNGLEKKEYFVKFVYSMVANGQGGTFADPFELVLSETPFCRPCSSCSHYSIDQNGVSVAKIEVGTETTCVDNAGTCEVTVGETRSCYAGGDATSLKCYTPCEVPAPSSSPSPPRRRRLHRRHRRRHCRRM